jgi:preprotein translocase subunit SecG
MLGPLMFWTNLLIDVLVVIYVIDCIFMGLVIMMQRSKQEGLGAAFGGGFTESVWGAQTSQVLVKATVYAAIIFFALSIILARLYTNRNAMIEHGSAVQQELLKAEPVPAKPVTPGAAAPATTTPSAVPTPVPPTATPSSATTAPAAPAKPATAPTPANK